MNRKWVLFLASGAGFGYSPIASGTVGSLWGVLLVWLVFSHIPLAGQVVCAVLLSLAAVPICDAAEKWYGRKDDGRIVADEYMTFPICVLGIWPAIQAPGGWKVLAAAFVVCRIMDIVKPFPARRLQDLHGGLGIVIDDVIASLYALVVNHLLVIYVFGA